MKHSLRNLLIVTTKDQHLDETPFVEPTHCDHQKQDDILPGEASNCVNYGLETWMTSDAWKLVIAKTKGQNLDEEVYGTEQMQ